MNLRKRQIRAARKAKAQRLQRWQGVPTPASQFATQGVTLARKRLGKPARTEVLADPPGAWGDDREPDEDIDDGPAYLHDVHGRDAMAADAFDAELAGS